VVKDTLSLKMVLFINQKTGNMYTSYHFSSAQEINDHFLLSIKAAFQNRPIIVTVEETEEVPEGMTADMVEKLEERLQEDKPVLIDAKDSLNHLKDIYGIPH
jgi:hypothetical protein